MDNYKFSMGALVPPELSWQEGKTASEISTINLLLKMESCLGSDTNYLHLVREIDEHMKWLGVRK